MERVVEPELLDQLPATDPRAIHSRRDLRRINFWMGNFRLIEQSLARLRARPRTILEIGAGDGTLMVKIAEKFAPVWKKDIVVYFLDMRPSVSGETRHSIESHGWKTEVLQVNLRDWVQRPNPEQADLILANLFLHHFSFEELKVFFRTFSKVASTFLACDPRRSKASLSAIKLLWLIGCNSVTRNDARVSIHAGFRDKELSALWPRDSGFRLQESDTGWASHLLFAQKPNEAQSGKF